LCGKGWGSRITYTKTTQHIAVDPFGTGAVTDTSVIEMSYNALGAPKQVVHADGTKTLHEYDARGLPSVLSAWGKSTPDAAPAWLELGKVERGISGAPIRRNTPLSNQLVQWRYDRNGRVTSTGIFTLPCTPSGGFDTACKYALVAGERLTYEDVGNVRSVENIAHAHVLDFTYDPQHQLETAVSRATNHAAAGETYAAYFGYHPGGRVREVDITASAADIPNRHVRYDYPGDGAVELRGPGDAAAVAQLTRLDVASAGADAALASFDYDARGNLVERVYGGDTTRFVYDANGRLREARNGGAYEVYYYDHNGQRMLAARSSFAGQPARVRRWFGAAELWYDADGSLAKRIAHLSLGQPVADIRDGDVGQPQFQYNGVLGSLLAVVDRAGELRASYSYGPYGELLASSGDKVADYDRLYNGKELDELTGLSYYGYRYYDRSTLTWIAKDPLYRFAPDAAYDEPRRMGLYAFNLNNPILYVDPDGRNPAVACLMPGISAVCVSVSQAAIAAGVGVLAWVSSTSGSNEVPEPGRTGRTDIRPDSMPDPAPTPRNTRVAPREIPRLTRDVPGSQEVTNAQPAPPPRPVRAGRGNSSTGQDAGRAGTGRRARDSSKAERHGDGGRALAGAEQRIAELRKQLQGASKKEAKKIKQKIQNIRQAAQRKAKGETHHIR